MSKVILHVDMDAFYASVEVLDRPEYRGLPLLVGGAGARGVVAAASYEARTFGCHSAQPMAVALRRCPHATVVSPRMARYRDISRSVFKIFESYTPVIEPLSIDEAFLDVTESQALFGAGETIAAKIRADVRERVGITCSIGVSGVKFVAKLASAYEKPDGLTVVGVGDEQEFLDPLPVNKLWGVGPKTHAKLREINVHTIRALREVEVERLEQLFGDPGRQLGRLARGVDLREVTPGRVAVQVSREDTYPTDLTTRDQVYACLLSQATSVADRLTRSGRRARQVFIKIRGGDFHTVTRQRTFEHLTAEASTIYDAAKELFDALGWEPLAIRLTGVGVAGFEGATEDPQLELFGEEAALGAGPASEDRARRRVVQETMTAVRSRFGAEKLAPAGGRSSTPSLGGRATSRNQDEDD